MRAKILKISGKLTTGREGNSEEHRGTDIRKFLVMNCQKSSGRIIFAVNLDIRFIHIFCAKFGYLSLR